MKDRSGGFRRHVARALAAGLLVLAGCGGGGGGGGDGDEGRSVAGTLTVSANLVVDSDTNDPRQARVANDTMSTAQPIAASSQVVGTVNLRLKGPRGASYDPGDEADVFRVTLAAGQTLELDFTADPTAHDVDLHAFRRSGSGYVEVGESSGTERSECLQITTGGEYWVAVVAYKGSSLYNLRIAAPRPAGACPTATDSAARPRVLPGQVIAGLADGSDKAAAAGALVGAQRLSLLKGRVAPGRLGLFALPGSERARRRGLLALAGASEAVLEAARRPSWLAELDDAARLRVETLLYAKRLRGSGAFDRVVPNRPLRAAALVGTFPPDDPRYGLQRWHYEQISLPTAMGTLAGLTPAPTLRPIVAVLDTGIVAEHPDLAGQLVDGFDFIRDAASAGDGNGIDADPDDLRSDATRPSFHGTHVAGTVAAATFNGTGVAGVAPMAQLMPLRVLGAGGEGSLYDTLQAMRYAAGLDNDSGRRPARRADVVNLSLGAEGVACDADTAAIVASVRGQGTMIVAAAGNASDRESGRVAAVDYPANCAGVLAVTATDARRGVAYYANGGAQVALAAPGGDTRVATTGSGQPDGIHSTLATFAPDGSRLPTYGLLQGTSMATPHVAGVLALMRWVHPAITPAQIDALLHRGELSVDQGARGRDDAYGWGIVDAAKAVRAALSLKNGGTLPDADGVVEAQPGTLDFGTTTTSLEFTLRETAGTDERVESVTADSEAVSVAPVAGEVDARGLGRYRVGVDRAALAAGLHTPTVTVRTDRQTLTIGLIVEKAVSAAAADIGPLYLQVYDAASGRFLEQVTLRAEGGRYAYRVGGLDAASVRLVAGSDYDNDGTICSRGEVCGGWPVLGADPTPIDLARDRDGLDFVVAPVDIGNATTASAAARARR